MMKGEGINTGSDCILHLIKENTIGVEIGVWKGWSTKKYLAKNVKMLHMVDPWSLDAALAEHERNYLDKRYESTVGGITDKDYINYYENVYNKIIEEFGHLENTKIYRTTSDKWFEENQDLKVDWIYVDGDHSYEGCLKDLYNARKIVKEGGLIIGDDYNKRMKPGVVKAVNEFASKTGLKLIKERKSQYYFKV